VPTWSRQIEGKQRDVIVGKLHQIHDCKCHQMITHYNVQTGDVNLSKHAEQIGIDSKSVIFIHSTQWDEPNVHTKNWKSWEWLSNNVKYYWDNLRQYSDFKLPMFRDTTQTEPYILNKRMYQKEGQQPQHTNHQNHLTIDGDNSISGEGTTDLNRRKCTGEAQQNYLSWIVTRFGYDDSMLVEDDDFYWIGVQGVVYINDSVRQNRTARYEGHFHTWCAAGRPAVSVTAQYGKTRGAMDTTLLTGFMQDGKNFNTRQVAGAINAAVGIPFNTSQTLAAYISLSTTRTDNTALYAKGWCLALMRHAIARRQDTDNPYIPLWNPAGVEFQTRNWLDLANIGGQFEEDVTNRTFVLLKREFPESMVNCLKHISRGGQPMEDQRPDMNPQLNRIRWFPIRISVYYGGPAPDLPPRDFNSNEMRATLLQLAASRNEQEYLAAGFTKALTLLAVKDCYYVGAVSTFTCTLELYDTFQWPHPADSNPIWRWLCNEPPLPPSIIPDSEIAVLQQQSMEVIYETAIVAGSLLSLGFGLAFNTMNINGRFLNICARPQLAISKAVRQFYQH
jgi:hypothetical protein